MGDTRIAECKHCGKVKHPDEFWCVINGEFRFYECKVNCKPSLRIEKKEEVREPLEIEDWAEAYPKETTFQKILRWILPGTIQYTKIKSQ